MKEEFSIAKQIPMLRQTIKDLTQPDWKIYWSHVSIKHTLVWLFFYFWITYDHSIFINLVLYIFLSFLVYHASVLTHEIAHFKEGEAKWLVHFWNLTLGCPLMVPSFLYSENHIVHHGKKYSTIDDVEYVSFYKQPYYHVFNFLALNAVLPFMGLLRFGVMFPLSLLIKPLRRKVLEKASFMGIKIQFHRNVAETNLYNTDWIIQEVISFLFVWSWITFVYLGMISWTTIFYWSSVMSMVGFLNAIRALAVTHEYLHDGEKNITWDEQILDSVDIEEKSLITSLLCPYGTQYHLTHHMFPDIPFHNLDQARLRLKEFFLESTFYHRNCKNSIIDGLWNFWKVSTTNSDQNIDMKPSSLQTKVL